jgi:pimeloyl-ACP methyl ester carboxylesterase
MHLYCEGSGTPTVVLESGGGDDWLYWQKVQPEAARLTRVCSYDRAGLGWSDPQPGPRDAKNIALQLHELLEQAHEPGPFVLAGGSVGGFYVREFESMFSSQVVGMLFVDSSVPDQFQKLPGAAFSEKVLAQKHREARWQSIQEASGWARLAGDCKGAVDPGLEAYADFARAEECRPLFKSSAVGEWDEFWHSGAEAAQSSCCDDLPVVIISQDPDRPKPGWSADLVAAQPIWNGLQESLLNLSPHSRRVIARNSAHHVMIDRPDVVIRNLQKLITEIRAESSDPSKYRTTVVE